MRDNNVNLDMTKLTDFYYQLGQSKEVVNLRVDKEHNNVLSKILSLILIVLQRDEIGSLT